MYTILVAEDEPNARRLMCCVLEQAGYATLPVADGEAALDALGRTGVDLAVVDILMPRMDGLELTRRMRERGLDTPVIITTALGTMPHKRAGFGAGADDYMVKPVDEEELLLRVDALLRRAHADGGRRLAVGATTLDHDAFAVTDRAGLGGEARVQELPRKEFLLLWHLLAHQGKVFTRRQLMDEVWSADTDSDERTVDVHISHLRERFQDSPDFQIVTLRGLGYKAVAR